MTVNVDYVHREYKDIPALVETNGIYDGNVFKGYRNEDFNQIYSITNDTWNKFVYDSISMNASKRSKWLQILGSYTRGFQNLEGTWRPNDPASFIQPDAYPNDTGLGSIRGNQTNSLSGHCRHAEPVMAEAQPPPGQHRAHAVGSRLRAELLVPVRRFFPSRASGRRFPISTHVGKS